MAKSKAKHYPPAYYKYREAHPTISIVLTKDTKAALDKVRGDLSYAKFLTSLITPDGVFSQFKKQRAQLAAEKVSLEKEKKRVDEIERFSLPCPDCGTLMLFDNKNPIWNSEIKPKLQKMFQEYGHEDCGK